MVSVAKGLDAPIKILFPKALGTLSGEKIPMSMLGLGDIVIPGIFVALMLRFDASRTPGGGSRAYFISNLVAYTLGLCATVGVMHFFDHAQPALLYLVPACILSSLGMASARGELKELLNFSVEKAEQEKKD
jgi:minor histocompatibility antigen H13